jgi:hypothetical protein
MQIAWHIAKHRLLIISGHLEMNSVSQKIFKILVFEKAQPQGFDRKHSKGPPPQVEHPGGDP